jgi:hypothetical protein
MEFEGKVTENVTKKKLMGSSPNMQAGEVVVVIDGALTD